MLGQVGIDFEGTEGIYGQVATGCGRYRTCALAQIPIVLLDTSNVSLKRGIQRDTLRTKDQLMKIWRCSAAISIPEHTFCDTNASSKTTMAGRGLFQAPF